jgi:hypothetical protein
MGGCDSLVQWIPLRWTIFIGNLPYGINFKSPTMGTSTPAWYKEHYSDAWKSSSISLWGV